MIASNVQQTFPYQNG